MTRATLLAAVLALGRHGAAALAVLLGAGCVGGEADPTTGGDRVEGELIDVADGKADGLLGECTSRRDTGWQFAPRAVTLARLNLRMRYPEYDLLRGQWELGDALGTLDAGTCVAVIGEDAVGGIHRWVHVWIKPRRRALPMSGWLYAGDGALETLAGDTAPHPLEPWTPAGCGSRADPDYYPRAITLSRADVRDRYPEYSALRGRWEPGTALGTLDAGACVEIRAGESIGGVDVWYLVRRRGTDWGRGGSSAARSASTSPTTSSATPPPSRGPELAGERGRAG